MQRIGEAYNGPAGVYSPEKIPPEVLQQSARIVCEHLHEASGLENYWPDNIGGTPIFAVDQGNYGQILEGIEDGLSTVIPFDDYDHTNPENPLNPRYPRSQMVMRALMAGAIQDTFTYGNFVGRAAALVRNPEQIMERARKQGETDDSAHAQLFIALRYTYEDAQLAARAQITAERQPAKRQWYAALDGLQPLLSRELEGGRRTGFEKERAGYITELNHTVGNLLGRILEDVDTIAHGRPNRLPKAHREGFDYEPTHVVFPAQLIEQVTKHLEGLEGNTLEQAKLKLAVGYLRDSISPNVHVLMAAKYDQVFTADNDFFEPFAELTVPSRIGSSDRFIWSQPASEPLPDGADPTPGNLAQARAAGSSDVNTGCPASMHFMTSQGADQFREQFGAEVPHRFARSPADQAMHIALEAYRVYISHRLTTDNPLQSAAAYLERYKYWG